MKIFPGKIETQTCVFLIPGSAVVDASHHGSHAMMDPAWKTMSSAEGWAANLHLGWQLFFLQNSLNRGFLRLVLQHIPHMLFTFFKEQPKANLKTSLLMTPNVKVYSKAHALKNLMVHQPPWQSWQPLWPVIETSASGTIRRTKHSSGPAMTGASHNTRAAMEAASMTGSFTAAKRAA